MLNPVHDQHENGTDHKGRVEMQGTEIRYRDSNKFPGADSRCSRSRHGRNGVGCHLTCICRIGKPGQHFRRRIEKKWNGEQGVQDIARRNGATQ